MAKPLFGGDNLLTAEDLIDIAIDEENRRFGEGFENVYGQRLWLRTAPLSDLLAARERQLEEKRALSAQRFRGVLLVSNPDERRLVEEIGRRIARDVPRVLPVVIQALGRLPAVQALANLSRKGNGVAQPIQGNEPRFVGDIPPPPTQQQAPGSGRKPPIPGLPPGIRIGEIDNVIGPDLTPKDPPAVKAKDDKIS